MLMSSGLLEHDVHGSEDEDEESTPSNQTKLPHRDNKD